MEDVQRNNVLELSSVSGVLYVMIDNQSFYHCFKNCVKVCLETGNKTGTSKYGECNRQISYDSFNSEILRSENNNSDLINFELSHSSSIHDDSAEIPPSFDTQEMHLHPKNNSNSADEICNGGDINKKGIALRKSHNQYMWKKNEQKKHAKHLSANGTTVSVLDNLKDGHGALKITEKDSREMAIRRKVKKSEIIENVYCEYCSKDFGNQQEFYNHRKSKRENHCCEICQKVFPFKAHLLVHMYSHRKDLNKDNVSIKKASLKLKCDVCGSIMANNVTFKTHMMKHTGENAYQCCVCLKNFNSIGRFGYHLNTHRQLGKVFCKICKIGFETRSDLSKHQLTHRYKCDLCETVFPNKTSRHFHYKLSHKDNILKCPQCDKLYSSESELQLHIKYHQNRQKTQCTICGRLVSRLDDHMLSHSNHTAQEASYVCDQCPKEFRNKLSFQRHLRSHSDEKPYACTHCPKKFGRSTSLSRHMLTHTQQKPYVCSICGKACTQMCNLKSHMQIHKESSEFQFCKSCGAAFLDLTSLQEHRNSVHAPPKTLLAQEQS